MPIDATAESPLRSRLFPPEVGAATLVMVAVAALYLRWGHAPAWNFIDLTDFFYGGVSVLDGVDLYAPRPGVLAFNYPPFAGAIFVPLAIIGLGAAKAMFTALTLAAYAVSLAAIRRAVEIPWSTTLLIGAIGLSLEPVVRTLVLGQIGVILMALVLADLFLVPPRFRGLLIGLAAGIKLTPALFVLWFVLRRDRTSVARAAGAAFASVAVGWMAAPVSSQRYWLGGFDKLDRFGNLAFTPVNQSMISFVTRVTGGATGPILWATVTLVAGLVLGAAVVLARRGSWPGVALTLAGATLLLSPISWTHHWVWVVPLLAAVTSARHGVAAAVVTLVFYAAPMWFMPESGALGPVQVVMAYAYLVTALALLLATITFPSIGRMRPARTR